MWASYLQVSVPTGLHDEFTGDELSLDGKEVSSVLRKDTYGSESGHWEV